VGNVPPQADAAHRVYWMYRLDVLENATISADGPIWLKYWPIIDHSGKPERSFAAPRINPQIHKLTNSAADPKV
jgi:hypothetical protein